MEYSMEEMIEIPNKSSFKINEVCSLTGVKSYVLRFWESEFEEINPMTSSSGVKLYEHQDIEVIMLIKKMLFEEKMSVEKAKLVIKDRMPKSYLVEEQFNEFHQFSNASNLNSDYDLEEVGKKDFSQVKRTLIDSEFQKLIATKHHLKAMLGRLEKIEKIRHWC